MAVGYLEFDFPSIKYGGHVEGVSTLPHHSQNFTPLRFAPILPPLTTPPLLHKTPTPRGPIHPSSKNYKKIFSALLTFLSSL